MDISIMIEGQMGLTWDRWRALVPSVEGLGFAGLFRSDHFTNPSQPDRESLEMIVSLAFAAEHTERIHFGPLVAPVSFRDPVMLARQAAALSDLSGGRFILGLGAGWQEREHREHGYDLLDVRARMDRLAEGMEIAERLLHGDGPQTFEGTYFQIRDAEIRPAPSHRVPLLLGGNGIKRSLPIAARYADIWNGLAPTPEGYRERCARLDELLDAEGRKPGDLRRTMMTGVHVGRDGAALERRLAPLLERFPDKTASEVVGMLRERGVIAGTTDEVREQLQMFAGAGVEEIMLQWLALDDLDGLEELAGAVLSS